MMAEPKEGQTATNPENGVRIIYRGGNWHEIDGSGRVGRIYGRAKTPPPQTAVDAERDKEELERIRQQNSGLPVQQARDEIALEKDRLELEAARKRAADPTGALGIEQARAAGFYGRAMAANKAYESLDVGAEPASLATAKNVLPEGVVNYLKTEDRQKADANVRGFISSVLRYESGAAIPPEEFESAYKTYFPQAGESAEVAAEKRRLRAEAVEAVRIGAGAGGREEAQPRLSDEEFRAELRRLIQAGDREAALAFMGQQQAREANPGELDRALAAGDANVRPPIQESPELSIPARLGESAANVIAGLGQGAASLVDIPAKALGAAMAEGADALGFDSVAEAWRDPFTIGGAIEEAVPTPDNFWGKAARIGAEFAGGAAALPARATASIADQIVGKVPAAFQTGKQSAQSAASETVTAAQRQNIPLMPADVAGPTTRRLTAAAAQAPVSAGPVINAGRRTVDKAQAARDRVAASIGEVLDTEAAGEAARKGALSFIGKTSETARTAYNRAGALAKGVRVDLPKARETIDANIAELGEVPGGAEGLEALKALRNQIDGEFTVEGIRGMRTAIRDRFLANGLRGSDLERRMNQVIDAATEDMADGLSSAGKPEAAAAYRAADRYWRARVKTIDEVLAPVIGKGGEKSGEQVIQTLERASRADAAKLSKFVRALPEEEQAMVRATFIAQLGRPGAGSQNAEGSAFSLSKFLTDWNRLSPGAKNVLFTGESRSALNDLAKVAEGTKEAQRYANHSNTLGAATGQLLVSGGLAMLDLATAGKVLAAQYGAGRLLASPKMVRWFTKAGRQAGRGGNPSEHIEALTRIAAAESAIAPEVLGLQRRLAEAFAVSPATRAAAKENEDVR